jgi:sporadic carbohydrate cluster 2OG-Fe(II) oxygenase
MTEIFSSFQTVIEKQLEADFLATGYVIRGVEDQNALDGIRAMIVDSCSAYLGDPAPASLQEYLDNISSKLEADHLNALRLDLLSGMQNASWLRAAYYSLARDVLAALVGNELAMQKNINLSIQLPGDESSLLPVHADVLNGDSPFEVVLWVPLVDCHATKSMYILSPERNTEVLAQLGDFSHKTSEDLFHAVKDDVTWLTVPYGSYIIFSQNLLHGNRVNEESKTRWSMNCRFKSLLSPYADKKFGEFFEPITMRPATRLGLTFRAPLAFNDE